MVDPTFKISLGGIEFLLPATARIVVLSKTGVVGSPLSLEEAGVDYVVPTSKKFQALLLVTSCAAVDRIKIIQNNTADSAATEVLKAYLPTDTSPVLVPMGKLNFPVEKYINVNTVSANSATVTVIVVELDA